MSPPAVWTMADPVNGGETDLIRLTAEPTVEKVDDLPAHIRQELEDLIYELDTEMVVVMQNMVIDYHNFYVENIHPRELETILYAIKMELPVADPCEAYQCLEESIDTTYAMALQAHQQGQCCPDRCDDHIFEMAATRAKIGYAHQLHAYERADELQRLAEKVTAVKDVLRLMSRGPGEAMDYYNNAIEQHNALINMAGDAYNGAIAMDKLRSQRKSSGILGLAGSIVGGIYGAGLGAGGAAAGSAIGGAIGNLLDEIF